MLGHSDTLTLLQSLRAHATNTQRSEQKLPVYAKILSASSVSLVTEINMGFGVSLYSK